MRGSERSQAVRPALPGPGETVAGKYRIEREIGRGGMSVVFGATHRVTGRRFALKWLLPEVLVQPDAARRFIRESQISGRLQHPNVVEVFDIGEERGSHYMVMEWLEGETLAERLERVGTLSLREAYRYLIPCMRGVAAAHAAGIVHRDLKPANIFLCRATRDNSELAKVLDFGISKLAIGTGDVHSTVTNTGVLLGTPYYMSPEQMQAQPVDPRADVYAFGVILYQVLSGQLPFAATNYGALVVQVATETPRRLDELVPDLPREVTQTIARAMARAPAERFQNMQALIAASERFASNALPRPLPRPTYPTALDAVGDAKPIQRSRRAAAARGKRKAGPLARRRNRVIAAGVTLVVAAAVVWSLRSDELAVSDPGTPADRESDNANVSMDALQAAPEQPSTPAAPQAPAAAPAAVGGAAERTAAPAPVSALPSGVETPQEPRAAAQGADRPARVKARQPNAERSERQRSAKPKATVSTPPMTRPMTPPMTTEDTSIERNPLKMDIQ
jgi:eukaryotic-like serine/threonine-protein kinase